MPATELYMAVYGCDSHLDSLKMSGGPIIDIMAAEEQPKAPKLPKLLMFDDSAYLDKTLDSLNRLRKSKQFCDVILQVGASQDVREIHAHRAVLASASPYLFDLFSAENKGNRNQYKLNGNFDIDAFERLVDYAYTAKLEVPHDKVKATYIAANRLRMSSAAKQCGKYLIDNLNPENCIGLRSMPGVITDPEILLKVDNFIRQHVAAVVKSKELLALPTVQVELLQNSMEERKSTNVKHMCDMVLDWIKRGSDDHNIHIKELTEKIHMLYLNTDRTLHDCSDIENGDLQDSEVIQDYKKLSRKVSLTTSNRSKPRPSNQVPAKPRQFLYTKSDSSSSLSSLSEDDEKDWKVIATTITGEHSMMGVVSVSGKLAVLSVVQRVHTPSHSPLSSRNTSVEKISNYTAVPPMSSARCSVGTAELNGKLLVCGGYDRGECLKTVEAYDLSTNKWTTMKPMKFPRGRFDIAVVNEKVYAVGGCDGQKELGSAEFWEPTTNSWKQLPNLPVVRSQAGVCSVGTKIFVIGGWNGQRGLTRCDVFDIEEDKWFTMAPLKTGRYQAGVGTADDEVYAVGGCDSWNCLNSVEKYDPVNDTWTSLAALHTPRRGCGIAFYSGKLYAVGGHDGMHSLCSVEVYDPKTNSWSAGPPLTCCRANVGVTLAGNRLFAVGGFNGKTFLNTVEYLDPENNEWTTFVSKEEAVCSSENGLSMETIRHGDDDQAVH